MAGESEAVVWWIHPILAGSAVALAGAAVYFGRKSAKAPTASYAPILRLHIGAALGSAALAVVAAFIGISVVGESKVVDEFSTPHAFVGVAAVGLWSLQAALGCALWYEKEGVRKFHRRNGFLVLTFGLVQLPLGYALARLFV